MGTPLGVWMRVAGDPLSRRTAAGRGFSRGRPGPRQSGRDLPHYGMTDFGAILLLVIASVAGLLLIPLGLPGLWVILLGVIGYGWLTDFRTVSGAFLAIAIGLALAG